MAPAKPNLERREALKKKILTETIELASEAGWPSVSLRKVSARVNHSTIVIYDLFGSKEKLLQELAEDGFRLFLEAMFLELKSDYSPKDQIVCLSEVAWKFATENKELYEVMFGLTGSPSNNASGNETNHHLQEDASEHFQELEIFVQKYLTDCLEGDEESLFINWWALVQGFILIQKNKGDEELDSTFTHFMEAINRFLKL